MKTAYGLDRVLARTKATSEAWIRASFFVVNLLALSQHFLRRVFGRVRRAKVWLSARLTDNYATWPLRPASGAATF